MALNSLPRTATLLSCLFILSIIETVVAMDPSNVFFIEGGAVMGGLGLLAFPFGAIWGIPLFGVGIVSKILEETLPWHGDNEKPSYPTCGAVIVGLPETTSAAPTSYHTLAPREPSTITTTLIFEPQESLLPCPSSSVYLKKGQPYPNEYEKRRPAGIFNEALMACKSDNLRGKDVQRLRETSMRIYAEDYAMLKGSDFEVRGNVSWTKTNSTSGLIQGEYLFTIPGIDAPVEGVFLTINERAADRSTKDAFNLVMEAMNTNHRQSDFIETIQGLGAVL